MTFLEELANKLKDPEFRKTPGFPKGEDEDILRISDPPYYTACPNPFLKDFVKHYGRPYDPAEDYHREPFAVDVSVGKTDALYKAHGYHTKVPHLAIVPSILHYTKPGDIVLDGFCGSGMTGVAAQWCGSAPADYRKKIEVECKQAGREKPEWGSRRVILGDLGPAATFIAANYNLPFDVKAFEKAARRILNEVEKELGWMYETLHTDGKTTGRINYTVWSEVFSCPDCGGEIVFLREALDMSTKKTRDKFPCPHCLAEVTKRKLERTHQTNYDKALKRPIKTTRREPVLVNYSVDKKKNEKLLDAHDSSVLKKVAALDFPEAIPIDRMMHMPEETKKWGDEWRAGTASFSFVHELFLPRACQALGALWQRAKSEQNTQLRNMLLFFVEQAIWGLSLMARYAPTHFSQVNQYMSGRIRLLSQHAECSPWYILDGKLSRLVKAFGQPVAQEGDGYITTGDCGRVLIDDSSIDYIFTDPPFGHNFAYSELNFIVESFHGVFTNQSTEAIVSDHQNKLVHEYQELMFACMAEYYRVLKPGRWMTMIFSNSSNAIWRAIQEAAGLAGFVIADVRTLDKKQGAFNQVLGVSPNKDLIISAYKPTARLTERFALGTASKESIWAFIEEHLSNVPVVAGATEEGEVLAERTRSVLLDRMIAFHVQRNLGVPLSGPELFAGLEEKYPERDSMYFLADQVATYDRWRMKVGEIKQLSLFVTDEASAIQWLNQQLQRKPQSTQDLQPLFKRELSDASWAKHERTIELKELLEENFLEYKGDGPVPAQIHSYLSTNFKDLRSLGKSDPGLVRKATDRWYVPDPKKQVDVDAIRDRRLLGEFDKYKESQQKKIKEFRTEAIRTGFKAAYDAQQYQTIVDVAGKIPDTVLQEDEKLLMYYDVASMRLGE